MSAPAVRWELAGHYGLVQLSRISHATLCGPMVAFIELTKKCNLRCHFCDIWKANPLARDEMSYEDLLNLTADLKDLGVKYVALFGGEVMLRPDLFDVVSAMKRAGLFVVLDTNGYLLPQFHKRVLDTGVDTLVISLDSHRPEVHDSIRGLDGSYAKILDGLGKVQSLNSGHLKVVINSLIVKQNFRELREIVHLGSESGVKNFRFLAYNFIYPYNMYESQTCEFVMSKKEIEELGGEIEKVIAYCKSHGITLNSHEFLRGIPAFYQGRNRKAQCVAGYASIHVHASGKVTFCSSLDADIGNVRKRRLAEIWCSDEFRLKRRLAMAEPCDKCWVSCYIEQNHWFNPRLLAMKFAGLD